MPYNFLNEPYSGHFCCVYLICLDLSWFVVYVPVCTYADRCRPMYIYMYIGKNIYIGKNAQNNSDNLLQAVGAGWRVQTCLNWAWKVSKSLIKKNGRNFFIIFDSFNFYQLCTIVWKIYTDKVLFPPTPTPTLRDQNQTRPPRFYQGAKICW